MRPNEDELLRLVELMQLGETCNMTAYDRAVVLFLVRSYCGHRKAKVSERVSERNCRFWRKTHLTGRRRAKAQMRYAAIRDTYEYIRLVAREPRELRRLMTTTPPCKEGV